MGHVTGAILSNDLRYRYLLSRSWGAGPMAAFVMLNPSTADASENDPTIRRCIGFANSWGYAGLLVANLYAYRSTSPANLWLQDDPVGPDNDRHLREMLGGELLVVAAWGANARPDRVAQFWELAGDREVHALRVTKGGAPGHPLYLPATLTPEVFARSS